MVPKEIFVKKRHDQTSEQQESESDDQSMKPDEICLVTQKGFHHPGLFKRYWERFRVLSVVL